MAADDAFVVAQPSTPASYFHLLRRHALGEEHRPLIVFTPKSMLKRKEAASRPEDFMEGSGFRTVTPDAMVDPEKVRTLLLCSGRITWDLMVERGKRQGDELTTAIARVEQLYPHPTDALKAEIARYPHLEHVRWVQDEPVNMGPSPFYRVNVFADLAAEGHEVEVISRRPRARRRWGSTPATWRSRSPCSSGPSPDLPCTSPTAASRSSQPGGVTRRSPSPGSPSGSASSATCTPSSRRRSSGSPPGWRASTTRTTSSGRC
jgi:hypothetical protein